MSQSSYGPTSSGVLYQYNFFGSISRRGGLHFPKNNMALGKRITSKPLQEYYCFSTEKD
jgi:hypothetical protein